MATSMTSPGYSSMILTVKRAANLNDTAWIGKADPYVEMKVADADISTHHVRGAGSYAEFNESFKFNNVAATDVMHFQVYDKKRLRADALIGEGSLMLSELFDCGALETRVPLASRGGVKDAGELFITARVEGEAGRSGAYAGEQKAGHEKPGVAGTGMGMAGAGMAGAGYAEEGRERGYAREREAGAAGGAGWREGEKGRSQEGAAAAAAAEAMGAGGVVERRGEAQVCGQEYFTKVEDRPVYTDRVERLVEHHPVGREFVVETRPTGAVRETAGAVESGGTTERAVGAAEPKAACDL